MRYFYHFDNSTSARKLNEETSHYIHEFALCLSITSSNYIHKFIVYYDVLILHLMYLLTVQSFFFFLKQKICYFHTPGPLSSKTVCLLFYMCIIWLFL